MSSAGRPSEAKRFFHLNLASLRFRLSLWHLAFTFLCMSLYGAVLSQYLKHELRASREQTMLLREHRFLSFVEDRSEPSSRDMLTTSIRHFSEASPDTDTIEILDLGGRRLYPENAPGLPLPRSGEECETACLTTFQQHGHQWRLLTHQTMMNGRPVWLLMSGVTDEHDQIMKSVRNGYFTLLPLVLLGALLGGYEMSRRALQPVGQMTETARRLSLTTLNGRLAVPKTQDELQALAEAWNDLLMRLEAEVNRSTRFTMDVSHDLRSAMTVILANAELSLRRLRTPSGYQAALVAIQQESTHVLTMLEDMLLASRSKDTAHSIVKVPVAFYQLITEVSDASRAAASIKQQTLRVQLSGCEGLWVLADRSLLHRMVSSLIDNSLKYTPSGGLIEISCRRQGESFVFAVRDNGIGISPELQGCVFDRLFRVDSARSRKDSPGLGLGLSIVRWIVEIHGFRIDLQSGVNQGSTFSVRIPAETLVLPARAMASG